MLKARTRCWNGPATDAFKAAIPVGQMNTPSNEAPSPRKVTGAAICRMVSGDGTALGPQRPDEVKSLDPEKVLLRIPAYAGASRLAQLERPISSPDPIPSQREHKCLSWLVGGQRNRRIAERMEVSVATVGMHLASARRELGVRRRAILLREF